MLDVRFFGHPEIRYAGQPVKFAKRSTTLAMLGVLMLKRGNPISRDSLAFTLFPEIDEAAALSELRRYLYLSNKALPALGESAWIVSDAETVRWNGSARAFVDFLEFERLGRDASTQPQAIDLYAGDLLENIYDDWVLAERERLRSLFFQLLDQSIERCRSDRDFGGAIAYANRLLAADPWREDALRTLVTLRYESGDTAGALAEYDRFAKRLRDELSIAPMPETVAVRQSILRNETLPGTSPVAAAAEPPATIGTPVAATMPFVARTHELSTLTAAWSRAARGNGSMVVISGEAGVGKTRLANELARIVQSEGGRAFAGGTSAPESLPYQSIVGALRSGMPLLEARPMSAERRSVLATLLPELAGPDRSDVTFSETSSERAEARVHEALSSAIAILATPRPLLLVLEDLHWAGPATIEALGAVFRDIARRPVLIVVTCRLEETPPTHPLRTLQRSLDAYPNLAELQLEPFDEPTVRELVHRIHGLETRDAELPQKLFARSEGNALFLDEAIRAIADGREQLQ